MSIGSPAFDYGYGVPGMPMPACATAERRRFFLHRSEQRD
jgi:hypothetical protein